MTEFLNVFVLAIFFQTIDLHGTWMCHKDEILWVDPEFEELLPGSAASINYYGWRFTLNNDGTGEYSSIGDQWVKSEDEKFVYSSWSFSIYNVLSRENVYSIYFISEGGEVQGYKLSVFGAAIPTITYNFKF